MLTDRQTIQQELHHFILTSFVHMFPSSIAWGLRHATHCIDDATSHRPAATEGMGTSMQTQVASASIV